MESMSTPPTQPPSEQPVIQVHDSADDAELLKELRRVRSDISFRKWTKRRLVFIIAVVILDLLATILSTTALVLVHSNQLANCHRDNTLRAAQVQLWEGVIVQAQQTNQHTDPQQIKSFEDSLHQQFAQHGC